MSRVPATSNPLTIWTVILAALVAGLLVLNWQAANYTVDVGPLKVAGVPNSPSAVAAAGSARERKVAVEADFAETIARPLFNPSRRPVSAALKAGNEPQVAAVEPALQARLIGLMATPARGKRVLVRAGNDKVGTWLAIGEELQGWRLHDIGYDRAIFESGGRHQELQLEMPANAARKSTGTP